MSTERSGPPWSREPEPRGTGTQLNELKDLVVGYAKQETVDPLRSLGRSLGFGIAGSVLIGTGAFLLLLALLRGLQELTFFNDPTSVDGGTWSWLPYLITATVGMLLAVLFLWKLVRFASRSSENR